MQIMQIMHVEKININENLFQIFFQVNQVIQEYSEMIPNIYFPLDLLLHVISFLSNISNLGEVNKYYRDICTRKDVLHSLRQRNQKGKLFACYALMSWKGSPYSEKLSQVMNNRNFIVISTYYLDILVFSRNGEQLHRLEG
jgi:hypothetical protein